MKVQDFLKMYLQFVQFGIIIFRHEKVGPLSDALSKNGLI